MRRIRGLVCALLLAGVWVVLGPASSACACSCVGAAPQEHLDWADTAFVGVVADIDRSLLGGSSGDPVKVTLVVESVLKGTPGRSTTVTTSLDGASCGYRFDIGNRYRVYAKQARTGLCAGNELLGPAPEVPIASSSTTTWFISGVGLVMLALAAGLWLRNKRLRSYRHRGQPR